MADVLWVRRNRLCMELARHIISDYENLCLDFAHEGYDIYITTTGDTEGEGVSIQISIEEIPVDIDVYCVEYVDGSEVHKKRGTKDEMVEFARELIDYNCMNDFEPEMKRVDILKEAALCADQAVTDLLEKQLAEKSKMRAELNYAYEHSRIKSEAWAAEIAMLKGVQ